MTYIEVTNQFDHQLNQLLNTVDSNTNGVIKEFNLNDNISFKSENDKCVFTFTDLQQGNKLILSFKKEAQAFEMINFVRFLKVYETALSFKFILEHFCKAEMPKMSDQRDTVTRILNKLNFRNNESESLCLTFIMLEPKNAMCKSDRIAYPYLSNTNYT